MENQNGAEKNKLSKKNLWLIIVGSVIGVAIIVGILLAFLLNYNVNAPDKVVVDKQEKTYFSVTANDSYVGYRFKFKSENTELVFDSKSNVITMEELEGLVAGEKYEITACYLAETEGANSDYSQPITWICYFRLSTPNVSYQQGVLSWDKIENDADYYTIMIFTSTGLIQTETTSLSFDLNDINGGVYQIYVCANSNNKYYEQSILAEKIEVSFIKNFKPFESATLDTKTKILTIIGSQLITNIDIKIDYKVSKNYSVTYKRIGDKYQYEINLNSSPFVVTEESNIEVNPSTIDSYNIYSGQPTTVVMN